jgi:hypothetical protein
VTEQHIESRSELFLHESQSSGIINGDNRKYYAPVFLIMKWVLVVSTGLEKGNQGFTI